MDTKLKKLKENNSSKLVAFLLAVVFFCMAVNQLFQLAATSNSLDPLLYPSYQSSSDFSYEFRSLTNRLSVLSQRLRSEEYILEGNTVTPDRLRAELPSTAFRTQTIQSASQTGAETTERKEIGDIDTETLAPLTEKGALLLEETRQSIIDDDLNAFYNAKKQLDSVEGFYYYMETGGMVYTNLENPSRDFFTSAQFYSLYEKDGSESSADVQQDGGALSYRNRLDRFYLSNAMYLYDSDTTAYVCFTQDYFAPYEATWTQAAKQQKGICMQLAIHAAISLLGFIYLLFSCGHKKGKEGITLAPFDRIFTDLIFIAMVAGGIGLYAAAIYSYIEVNAYLGAVLMAVATSFVLLLLLSLVRQLKNHTFWRHTLLVTLFRKLIGLFQVFLHNKPYTNKMLWLLIGYSILLGLSVFVFPIFLLLLSLAIWYLVRKCRNFNKIMDGTKRIRAGELNHKIIITNEKSELYTLAEDINSIAEGLGNSIDNELKSERLKTELITNVSHDIRTPLTSIITYVDLLKKEVIENEDAKKYIDILDHKANRLKVLTDDLFDAAKATSGNVKAEISAVDLSSLLTQGMGELNDKLKASTLTFKINAPEHIWVKADGKLLWRVIENLLSNVLKYALRESRVYIDILDEMETVRFTMKNISAYELNMDPAELLLRFKRGDASRHSEGSGLGLAIAQSLVEAQGGEFVLTVDGDLFKATIILPKAPKTE